MIYRAFLLFFWLIIPFISVGQWTEQQEHNVDYLFAEWKEEGHPGGVVAIKQHGKLLYHKAFGLANIEHQIPNTPNTLFNIASISKQFTAFGILLLQKQGKLSIDDNVRLHLPEVPDFGDTITIRHLLHHTSGLRSVHAMLELAGWRSEDPRYQHDIMRFLQNQTDLNFTPGSEYAYCNTGYIVLAQVIEKITQQPFERWMKTNVFEPLGMPNTYFERDYTNIVPNNADSYKGKKPPFQKAKEYWGYVGTGNLHTSVPELLNWTDHFHSTSEEYLDLFNALETLDPLNDGSKNEYAFGLFKDTYKGADRIQHGGAVGGFRSYVAAFRDQGLTIILLTNFTGASVTKKVNAITDLVLPNLALDETFEPIPLPIELPTDSLKKYEGHYWYEKKNIARKIYVENDTLWYIRTPKRISPLQPVGQDLFVLLGTSKPFLIKFNPEVKTMIVGYNSDNVGYFNAYTPFVKTEKNGLEYVGTYKSPELEAAYEIHFKNGIFTAYHSRWGELHFDMVKRDYAQAQWPLDIVKFTRNLSGEIDGFFVDNGRAKRVWFERVAD